MTELVESERENVNRSRSLVLPTLVAFTLVLLVACSPEREPADGTTRLDGGATPGPDADAESGELIHAWVLLQDDLDPGSSELPLLVTHGGCTGGVVPEAVERVELVETQETVRIAVFIRLPPGPYLTTCPANPEIEHSVMLDSPVGERTVQLEFGDETYPLWPIDH